MTVIEFFDDNAIENIVSTLLCRPDHVIFIGSNRKQMLRAIENYQRIARGREIPVEFDHRVVNKNNLTNIIEELMALVEKYGVCTFDLAGGDDLYLVAIGILFEYFGSERVQLHRFNIRNGSLTDCDADGNMMAAEPAVMTIEENIWAYGGRIVYEEEDTLGTYRWDFSEDFCADINDMWEICRRDATHWNSQITLLAGLEQPPQMPDPALLKELELAAVIRCEEGRIIYKNEQVQRCLSKAGTILELKITLLASRQTDKKGRPLYNDILCGGMIDWHGFSGDEESQVRNEVDVLLMKGLVPIFISCKNGQMEVDELYKLNTVARRFGGKYAKRVLVASELEKMKLKGEYIHTRAEDMGIQVVDEVDTIGEEKLIRAICSLWSN